MCLINAQDHAEVRLRHSDAGPVPATVVPSSSRQVVDPGGVCGAGAYAESLGFAHVESGPLVRSSYHARDAVAAAEGAEVHAASS
jgi:hypothetical protein